MTLYLRSTFRTARVASGRCEMDFSPAQVAQWDEPITLAVQFGLQARTSAWADIREKAKRIRSSNGVNIIASDSETISAEVQGSSAVYTTSIQRVPGTKQIGMWYCTCPWAMYSWGRSGRWQKFEGRMCAHALALSYETQSMEFGGNEIRVNENSGQWDAGDVIQDFEREMPGDWRKDYAASVKEREPMEMDEALFEPDVEAVLRDEPEGAVPMTTASRKWVMAGGGTDNADIAKAARRQLAKTSMKAFSTDEQRQIIGEGVGVMAGNLDRLDLAGTHYQHLEDLDDDDTFLW